MKPTILIADDEKSILSLLEAMLSDMNVNLIKAENGEDAIQKAFEYKPDLIVTDIVMPRKNGFDVCREVRNNTETKQTPIILLSALGDEYNKITGFEEGADDYLVKPFNTEDLKMRCMTLLKRYKHKHAPADSSTSKKTPVNKDIKEKPLKTNCFSTGIPELDQRLYGGLPKGSNILVLGTLGKGKSSFARQFIADGITQNEHCLFIALDDDPKKIREKLSEKITHPTTYYEEENTLRFVDAYSWSAQLETDERFALSGLLELNQLSGVISDAGLEIGHTIQEKQGGRRIIDSITSLFINFDLSQVQRFLTQISRTAIAFGGVTTLFIMEEGTVTPQIMNNIKYVMDGVIEFEEKDNKRCVRVASMKWTKSNSSWVNLPN